MDVFGFLESIIPSKFIGDYDCIPCNSSIVLFYRHMTYDYFCGDR